MSALALALLLAQPGEVRWERVHDASNAIVWLDPASLRRSGDRVWMRQRTEFRETDEYGMRSLVFSATIDCTARTYTMHRMEGYREDGSLIRATDFTADDADAVIPIIESDGSAQALYRRSCGSGGA